MQLDVGVVQGKVRGRNVARLWAIATATVVSSFGCSPIPNTFLCSTDDACGVAGSCEESGFCSFPDDGCESGRRYSAHGGALSRQCVPEDSGSSGGTTTGPQTTGALEPEAGSSSSGEGSSSSDGGTSGGSTGASALECESLEFDAAIPAQWVLWADGTVTEPTVEQGALVIDMTPAGDDGMAVATLSTYQGRDLSNSVTRTLVLEAPAGEADVTTGLELISADHGHSFGLHIRAGMAALVETAPDSIVTHTTATLPDAQAGLRLIFDVFEGSVDAVVIDESETTLLYWAGDAPSWLSDAVISVGASNASGLAPERAVRLDYIHVCTP